MKLFFILFGLFSFCNIIYGQCPEVMLTNKMLGELSPYDSLFVKSNQVKDNSWQIEIIGGYIHETDSIQIKDEKQIVFVDKIDNRMVQYDGASFSLQLSEFKNELTFTLDNCHYFISIPKGVKTIFIERVTPVLNIDFY